MRDNVQTASRSGKVCGRAGNRPAKHRQFGAKSMHELAQVKTIQIGEKSRFGLLTDTDENSCAA
jgi:hypothetical protein